MNLHFIPTETHTVVFPTEIEVNNGGEFCTPCEKVEDSYEFDEFFPTFYCGQFKEELQYQEMADKDGFTSRFLRRCARCKATDNFIAIGQPKETVLVS